MENHIKFYQVTDVENVMYLHTLYTNLLFNCMYLTLSKSIIFIVMVYFINSCCLYTGDILCAICAYLILSVREKNVINKEYSVYSSAFLQ